MKTCSKCKVEKDESEFSKNKSSADSLNSRCRSCAKDYREKNKDKLSAYYKDYHAKNRDRILTRQKEYYEENKEELSVQRKEHYEENKDKILIRHRNYRGENKDKLLAYHKEYYKRNRDRLSVQHKRYGKENRLNRNARRQHRYKIDLGYRTLQLLRRRQQEALYGKRKPTSFIRALGCTWEVFRPYIESKFKEGMTWDNHGFFGWHYDHVKPLSSFSNLEDIEQYKQAFHYTNLQPLWWYENLAKGDKLDWVDTVDTDTVEPADCAVAKAS